MILSFIVFGFVQSSSLIHLISYVCEIFIQQMIFVTGATGLLGSSLLQALLHHQQPVKALYHSHIPQFENSGKVEWVQGDILDVEFLAETLQNIQQVYHCAAIVSFQPKQREELYKTNVEGTANVVNACLETGVRKLVHVSSVAALGRTENTVIDETSHWFEGNSSEYGKSKYLAEMEVWRGIGEGLEAVIVNPSIILGAGDWNEGSSKFFKTVYNQFLWYTDGVSGFVDVLDVANAMILVMNSTISAERFILNAENVRYKELFDWIANGFGKNKPHRKVTPTLASLIWRAEAVRSIFTGSQPLLTKETVAAAQTKVFYNNTKLLRALPYFQYHPLQQSILRICYEYKKRLSLP
ncbi:MAG: NAD-dependent epimerase/dehydratase family protein [Bacteroidota bacterium]|nr:NAD-dependent epimerase/dehydratase family protein [Bacteroidota bacterium]